jgi:hypothetical protein
MFVANFHDQGLDSLRFLAGFETVGRLDSSADRSENDWVTPAFDAQDQVPLLRSTNYVEVMGSNHSCKKSLLERRCEVS